MLMLKLRKIVTDVICFLFNNYLASFVLRYPTREFTKRNIPLNEQFASSQNRCQTLQFTVHVTASETSDKPKHCIHMKFVCEMILSTHRGGFCKTTELCCNYTFVITLLIMCDYTQQETTSMSMDEKQTQIFLVFRQRTQRKK